MNELRYAKLLLFLSAVTTLCFISAAYPREMLASSEERLLLVGRADPFAAIFRKPEPVEKQTAASANANESDQADLSPQSDESAPELFVEIVSVKYLKASSAGAAIERLLSAYGTISEDAMTNSLVICDATDNLKKILAELKRIDKPRPALTVETVTLKFLDPKGLKPIIEGLSSQHGSIAIDSKSNSLIIIDTKENLDRILREIRKADKTPPQIMIEVVIVDVQLNDDTEIGINWDILSDSRYDASYRQNLGFSSRLTSTAETSTTIGNATAFVTSGTGGDFSVISGTIRNVIHMLQEKKDLEILASPRVMVLSGKTAMIKAVEEIPYNEVTETSGGGQLSSTEFKEVGVTLKVGATLTDNNLIHLIVDSEQNVQTAASDTGVPVVDTRNAQTELLLEDGQVVIFGGLRRKETKIQVKQIPILGDLPLIGFLFRSTNTVLNNSELIVFLSPHIYKGQPINDDEMAKYNEITKRPLLSIPAEQEKGLLE